jgi:hypothetical protein
METFVALLLTLNALPRAVHDNQIQSNLNHGVTSTYSVLLTLNARAVHDKQIQSNLNHGVTSTYSVLLTLNARAVHGNRSSALVVMRCS